MSVHCIALDLYSGDRVDDFAAGKAAGVQLIIHKATEGQSWTDPTYLSRRAAARAAGLLWAAYHFGTGAPVQAQVDRFLGAVLPDDDPTLRLVLDWELGSMSATDAKTFLAAVDARTGKRTILYSFLSFLTGQLGSVADREFASHPLWLAAWRDSAEAPAPQASWSRPLLWQYAADGEGGYPRSVAGIPGNALGQIDCNTAPGVSPETFRAAWLGDYAAPAHPHDWAWSQAQLKALGLYTDTIDGDPGANTERAVAAFIEKYAPQPGVQP